jgi:hypothetical protein
MKHTVFLVGLIPYIKLYQNILKNTIYNFTDTGLKAGPR